ncbi:FG-GAP-like repeat-containing protein [Streptomyces sp. NPDC056503]|uniref:FG-GAP-like repeat-containing protein n=1 Tax=Streptomyces sp. NPDC056503 TaxID=3345842 RepID=UPI0036D19459
MSVRRTVALALSTTLALTGLAAVTAPLAAAADTAPYEVTIAAPGDPDAPVHAEIQGAGTGVQVLDSSRVGWHDLRGGSPAYAPPCEPGDSFSAGDVVVCPDWYSEGPRSSATVHDFATGRTSGLETDLGEGWLPLLAGRHLVRYGTGADGATLYFVGYGENPPAGREARLPNAVSEPTVLAQDGTGAVLRYAVGPTGPKTALVLLDFASGTVTPLPEPPFPRGATDVESVALDARRILFGGAAGATEAFVLSRTDPAAPGRRVTLPHAVTDTTTRLGLVGDWLLGRTALSTTDDDYHEQAALYALPLAGGTSRDLGVTVTADASLAVGAGGAVYVAGTPDAGEFGVQRIAPGANGAPAAEHVLTLLGIFPRAGLTLSQGRLVAQDDGWWSSGHRVLQGYDLALTGTHAATARWSCDTLGSAADCPQAPHDAPYTRWWSDTGDGRLVTLDSVNRPGCTECAVAVHVTTPGRGGATRSVVVKHASELALDTVVRVSGRYVHFSAEAGGVGRSIVADIETGAVLRDSSVLNQSLWGGQLWTGSTTDGKVTAVDVRTGATVATADLGTSCKFTGLEVVGKWISARCANSTGSVVVHDREKRTSVWTRVPVGAPLHLGDGFVAFEALGHTKTLYVDDVRSGEAETKELGTVFHGADAYDGRWWTVDRFGGGVAFVDPYQSVRVTGLGGVTSRLTAIDADTPAANIRSGAWKPRWWLSKPGSSWTLTLKHKVSGKSVRTLAGGEARGIVAPSWDGKDAAGKYVPNGAYTWSLTVKPADGHGADPTASGSVAVSGAAAVWRDMAGDDGFGDLLVTDAAGAMSMYRGTGTGALSSRTAGVGGTFAAGSLFVPAGDLNGDRCADVYVRVGGDLRAYRPGCGKAVTASSPYTPVGSGWGGYDLLTSSGDVNGDGYVDLIARQASTGDVYFYGGTATHALKARVRIGVNWKLYRKLVGAGDLNGDGRGDLLGVDSAGVLWRYDGTATGGVTARVKVGGGWGVYSALVGVGDLSGDGRADLLARTTDGKLYRYASTGSGTYGGRVLIGTGGWNGFKGLF